MLTSRAKCRRTLFAALGSALCASVGSGCLEIGALPAQVDAARQTVEAARAAGAERCAPREMGLAEAHTQFAALEVRQANPTRARQHLDLAETNAQAAIDLTVDCTR